MKVGRLFSTSGRIGRGDFAIIYFVGVAIVAMFSLVLLSISDAVDSGVPMLLLIPPVVTYVWSVIAASIKRLHDYDRAGGWIFLAYLTLPAYWFLSRAGTDGPNRYGEPNSGSPFHATTQVLSDSFGASQTIG